MHASDYTSMSLWGPFLFKPPQWEYLWDHWLNTQLKGIEKCPKWLLKQSGHPADNASSKSPGPSLLGAAFIPASEGSLGWPFLHVTESMRFFSYFEVMASPNSSSGKGMDPGGSQAALWCGFSLGLQADSSAFPAVIREGRRLQETGCHLFFPLTWLLSSLTAR